jgi:hypothetical protein
MKARRAPYARSSVWYAVIALGVVVVIAVALGAIEIVHLRSQVHSLQSQLASAYLMLLKLLGQSK